MKQRVLYRIMTVGGILGMVASFLQLLEKLTLIRNEHAQLACNLNSIFSCSNVLNAWQSSVFGFPNSILCLTLFTVFTSFAVVGIAGSELAKKARLAVQGLALFTLAFGVWSLLADTYQVNALCIFCILCFVGLLGINWAWLRLNAADLPLTTDGRKKLRHFMSMGADTFTWLLVGLVMVFLIALHFG